MPNGMRWVGLDVHAYAGAATIFDDVAGAVVMRRVNGRPSEVLDVLRELRRPVRFVYEAGPTDYGLVRRACADRIETGTRGNIERRPGDRIKTTSGRRRVRACGARPRRPATRARPPRPRLGGV